MVENWIRAVSAEKERYTESDLRNVNIVDKRKYRALTATVEQDSGYRQKPLYDLWRDYL